MHYYQVDVLDFYRGRLSSRRLGVLVTDLMKRPGSSFLRAVNEGQPGWSPTDHLIADLWALIVQVNSDGKKNTPDHPVRTAMEAKARAAARAARRSELADRFRSLKARYRKTV